MRYHSTLISPILSHFFKIYITIFLLSIPGTLLFKITNGTIKVKQDTKKNNTSIEKKGVGFKYDLPTIYILHSNDDHYMIVKKK